MSRDQSRAGRGLRCRGGGSGAVGRPAPVPGKARGGDVYQHGEVQMETGPVMGEAWAVAKYVCLRT